MDGKEPNGFGNGDELMSQPDYQPTSQSLETFHQPITSSRRNQSSDDPTEPRRDFSSEETSEEEKQQQQQQQQQQHQGCETDYKHQG
ncbi:hypothetical protein MMC07_009707 [Pseudocyphellaria aurata]|nr:hypothetical protein [Pseudocyphellaria aurata]